MVTKKGKSKDVSKAKAVPKKRTVKIAEKKKIEMAKKPKAKVSTKKIAKSSASSKPKIKAVSKAQTKKVVKKGAKPSMKKKVVSTKKIKKTGAGKVNKKEKNIMNKATLKLPKKIVSKSASVSAISETATVDSSFSSGNECYMSSAQIKRFEEVLKQWKEQLMQQANATIHHMQDESANYPDQADRAYAEEEFSRELRTRDRERKLLKKIGDALERIKDNCYGYCDICGAEIGIKRLEARPTATQCVECKTVAELKEKQIGEIEES